VEKCSECGGSGKRKTVFCFVPAPDEATGDVYDIGPFAMRVDRELNRYLGEPNPPQDPICGEVPSIVNAVAVAIASSGLTATVLGLLRAWIDARNGRKLKIKVGDIEVEATQMAEKDILHLFDLIQQKADQQKIRTLLSDTRSLPAGTDAPGSMSRNG
jgi:hypothetical protein